MVRTCQGECRGSASVLHLLEHGAAQDGVHARLIALTAGLEPGEHIGVKTCGNLLLDRPLKRPRVIAASSAPVSSGASLVSTASSGIAASRFNSASRSGVCWRPSWTPRSITFIFIVSLFCARGASCRDDADPFDRALPLLGHCVCDQKHDYAVDPADGLVTHLAILDPILGRVRCRGSRKTSMASSKLTPCFDRFASALAGSQVNRCSVMPET
jgi:hypothetical protein